MAMKLSKVVDSLQQIAPESLAEPWDKVGLHVGSANRMIRSALLCIDLTEAVVAEAIRRRCQLVVAYHPPIFAPLTRLADGKEATWKERALVAAVRAKLAVYSPHTALDAVPGGINDWLCEGLGKGAVKPIVPHASTAPADRDEYKIVTYVPHEQADAVREAMGRGGAGWVGNYRQCSFMVPGVGTFLPLSGADPTIGSVGELARVQELRIEMLCLGEQLSSALMALRQAHPYEEPAIDVLKLEPEPSPSQPTDTAAGAGRLVTLDRPVNAQTIAQRIKKRLGVDSLKITPGHGPGSQSPKIRTIAVCVGSGGSLFEKIPPQSDVDAFLTGEMQHHQALDLQQQGKCVILAGHTHTERPFLPVYRDKIRGTAAGKVGWCLSKADHAPLEVR